MTCTWCTWQVTPSSLLASVAAGPSRLPWRFQIRSNLIYPIGESQSSQMCQIFRFHPKRLLTLHLLCSSLLEKLPTEWLRCHCWVVLLTRLTQRIEVAALSYPHGTLFSFCSSHQQSTWTRLSPPTTQQKTSVITPHQWSYYSQS